MNESLLTVENVWKTFPGADGNVDVLRGVNLTLAPADCVAITGPSGSGKSTLLHLIGTLDRPTRGRILLDGEPRLADLRNRHLGFIFQMHHLLPQLNVLENVLVPALINPASRDDAVAHARRLLARVGLEHRLSHRPGTLSGGERQRVSVVRALINRPRLVLADEPTGALDRAAAGALMDLLVEVNSEAGAALVVVTHAEHLAARMHRVLTLRDGELESRLHG
ncbi:MAG: ABC transporter ATP-binding protein [Verrucomicrobia bacterium]|nr:ABC transporter ATP-binding protein [Verrucomicrobiota bacterium]